MSLIYNPPPIPAITAASRSNHRSRHPNPQLNSVSHDLATTVTHLFLSSHLSLTLSQLVFCLRKGANFFFFLVSTPTPNLSDLAVAVLHPLRSLSFPRSLTLSSSSQRVYCVYVVNKCFYFDFLLC